MGLLLGRKKVVTPASAKHAPYSNQAWLQPPLAPDREIRGSLRRAEKFLRQNVAELAKLSERGFAAVRT
jgi:hypothetical protein